MVSSQVITCKNDEKSSTTTSIQTRLVPQVGNFEKLSRQWNLAFYIMPIKVFTIQG
ncbi:unnamed protein product [Acidithrix sp. C25]|nr:unnamed protein product [Acidithrix sp. C25]